MNCELWQKIGGENIYTDRLCSMNRWRHNNDVIKKIISCMFKIKFPTKRIFRIFPTLRMNGMAPFCNLFMERPSYQCISALIVAGSLVFVLYHFLFMNLEVAERLGGIEDPFDLYAITSTKGSRLCFYLCLYVRLYFCVCLFTWLLKKVKKFCILVMHGKWPVCQYNKITRLT